jgi:CheY-like chemotaxis protein
MKFLVIDDNMVDLLIAKAAVQRSGADFSIVTAESADEGLSYLKKNTTQLPDVILLDLNMPVKNGWDFIKEYQQLNITHIKLYILTSSVNENEKIEASKNSLITGFLSKPLRVDTLQTIGEHIKDSV